MLKLPQSNGEQRLWGNLGVLLKRTPPPQIIRQILCGYTMKVLEPGFKPAVIRIDILEVKGLPHPLPFTEIYDLMKDFLCLAKGLIGRMAISNKKSICVENRF